MHKTVILLMGISALGALNAHANLLTNWSFENTSNTFAGDANSVDELNSGSQAIPGWLTVNGVPTAWIKNGNPYAISTSNGQYFLDLTGYSNAGTYGGVSQSFATTVGVNYSVTFDLGYGGDSASFGGPVSVRASAGSFSGTFTSASGTPNPAVWDTESFDFTATSATTLFSLIGVSTAGGQYIGLDNVDVELSAAAVPEPAAYWLMPAGCIVLFLSRRRISSGLKV